MSIGRQIDRRTKVLEFRDDGSTKYAILSHRWIDPTEVDYEEIVDLAKMNTEERDEIRQRQGYEKILNTCERAQRDGYEWVWVDTCCIDKRSSAELSEAINSMYRWYANSRVCYAYLHDVRDRFIFTKNDDAYPESNGWPEWFSRGWTLQEMIAPSNLQFFNKGWRAIGDKKTLAHTLTLITEIPQHILKEGLFGNRPCVAQIISWAARRTTTRVEDRAYSLMGLLDVNMPMLYGEGKKAFHRLQLEIIRSSNDQSIFAWGDDSDVRIGSILADDPTFFESCSGVELMDHDEFLGSLKTRISAEELASIDQDRFGAFPITNRGIHIWMFLRRYYHKSNTLFKAYLPCRNKHGTVAITLTLWNSNYYRYSGAFSATESHGDALQFRQVYLRYQNMSLGVMLEIDDGEITKDFTCSDTRENTFILTDANPLCVKTYTAKQGAHCFTVAFGQYFGLDWVHFINNPPLFPLPRRRRVQYSTLQKGELTSGGLDLAQSMADVPSRDDRRRRLWIRHLSISTWIVRISRLVWERSKVRVRIEAFQHFGFQCDVDWKMLDINVSNVLVLHMDYHDCF